MAEAQREKEPLENKPEKMPPAGPHAKESLTDREKTPGTGALPEKNQPEADVGPD